MSPPAAAPSSILLRYLSTINYYLSIYYPLRNRRPRPPAPHPPRRDSDIWAIYSRLCLDHTLNYAQAASSVDDVDIESLNPGYAQPAYR